MFEPTKTGAVEISPETHVSTL